MKTTELRLGNWVQGGKGTIVAIYPSLMVEILEKRITFHKPILLTEEWLKKFGFEKQKCDNKIWYELKPKNAPLFCQGDKNGICEVFVEHLDIRVKYVHSLQNLYFALTNTELTIKK